VGPLPLRVPPTWHTFHGSRQWEFDHLERLERKLVQYEPLYLVYKQFMAEYESLDQSVTNSPSKYFLPRLALHKVEGDNSFKCQIELLRTLHSMIFFWWVLSSNRTSWIYFGSASIQFSLQPTYVRCTAVQTNVVGSKLPSVSAYPMESLPSW